MVVPASHVTADYDWWTIAERLAGSVGQPLVEGQLSALATAGQHEPIEPQHE